MSVQYNSLVKALGERRIILDEKLASYTTLKIGGPAKYFFRAQTKKDLSAACSISDKLKLPLIVLGGGTNILFSDQGFDGLVVKNESSQILFKGLKGVSRPDHMGKSPVAKVYLEAESGVSVNRLVRYTIDQGLSGLEYFLGQPGTVGGAVFINAHNIKKNQYFGNLLIGARIYRSGKGEVPVSVSYFRFGYDQSLIQKTKDIVLSVTLELERADKKVLWQKARQTLEYRRKTQPTGASAGCLFRNIKKSDALRLSTPAYTCSAGYLLDASRLKGVSIGKARLSSQHANFLINEGEAKASDVIELIKLARQTVKKKFAVDLELEIVLAGDF